MGSSRKKRIRKNAEKKKTVLRTARQQLEAKLRRDDLLDKQKERVAVEEQFHQLKSDNESLHHRLTDSKKRVSDNHQYQRVIQMQDRNQDLTSKLQGIQTLMQSAAFSNPAGAFQKAYSENLLMKAQHDSAKENLELTKKVAQVQIEKALQKQLAEEKMKFQADNFEQEKQLLVEKLGLERQKELSEVAAKQQEQQLANEARIAELRKDKETVIEIAQFKHRTELEAARNERQMALENQRIEFEAKNAVERQTAEERLNLKMQEVEFKHQQAMQEKARELMEARAFSQNQLKFHEEHLPELLENKNAELMNGIMAQQNQLLEGQLNLNTNRQGLQNLLNQSNETPTSSPKQTRGGSPKPSRGLISPTRNAGHQMNVNAQAAAANEYSQEELNKMKELGREIIQLRRELNQLGYTRKRGYAFVEAIDKTDSSDAVSDDQVLNDIINGSVKLQELRDALKENIDTIRERNTENARRKNVVKDLRNKGLDRVGENAFDHFYHNYTNDNGTYIGNPLYYFNLGDSDFDNEAQLLSEAIEQQEKKPAGRNSNPTATEIHLHNWHDLGPGRLSKRVEMTSGGKNPSYRRYWEFNPENYLVEDQFRKMKIEPAVDAEGLFLLRTDDGKLDPLADGQSYVGLGEKPKTIKDSEYNTDYPISEPWQLIETDPFFSNVRLA